MENKTLAVFGIVAYVLSVLSSATDLSGNSTAPVALILISGVVTLIFIIMAIVRLWKSARRLSIIFASSIVILSALTLIQEFVSFSYGSAAIIVLNIIRVIYLITTLLVIIKLFKVKK